MCLESLRMSFQNHQIGRDARQPRAMKKPRVREHPGLTRQVPYDVHYVNLSTSVLHRVWLVLLGLTRLPLHSIDSGCREVVVPFNCACFAGPALRGKMRGPWLIVV